MNRPKTKMRVSRPSLPMHRRRGRFRLGVEILAAAFAVVFTVPWKPADSSALGAFDFSWMQLLHDAFATGRQFGKEIILPQGPLGFIGNSVYDPRTYWVLIAARCAIALLVFWPLAQLGRKVISNALLALPWLLAVILLIGGVPDRGNTGWGPAAPFDDFFPGSALLLLLTYYVVNRRKLSASMYVLIVVLAAGSLIKVNQPFYAAAVIGIVTFDQILRRNWRFFLPPLTYLVCVLVFYVLARQSLSSLGAFLWGWDQVAFGHADAVGLPGPWTDAAAYVSLVLIFVGMVGVYEWRRWRFAGLLPTLGVAAVLLLLYKHSFMRQDTAHVHMGPMVALAATLLYAPVIWLYPGRYLRGAAVIVACIAATVLASILPFYTGKTLLDYPMEAPGRCEDNIGAAFGHLTEPGALTRRWEAARWLVREQVPLARDKIVGAVDVYPHRQDVVFAYDLNYRPRPVVSSLVASSPVLAHLNAAHLRGPSAPDTILFGIALVDNNYPTMLDGESFPDLLTRYDVIDASGGLLILRRTPAPRKWRLTPLTTLTGRFQESIPIPQDPGAPIWAQVRFKKRKLGEIYTALYKAPFVGIEVHTRDGYAQGHYRLLPTLAEEGFLLSPLIKERLDYAHLASRTWEQDLAPSMITDIKVLVVDGSESASFEPEFEVQLSKLEFERQK